MSEIAWTKTDKVEDVLKVGDEVDVKLLEIDAKTGKMRLSMRALTEKPEGYVEPKGNGGRGGNGNGNGGERRERREGGERRERRDDRHSEGHRTDERRPRRDDRPRRSGPRNTAPAPTADDFKEPVDELY